MQRFAIIWSGQFITLVGNSVLRFAFVIQAWTAGQQATQVVLLALCGVLPQVLLSPTAGALVDRCRKRTALMLADLGGLVVVGGLTVVYFVGHLELWQIYLAATLLGATAAFQYPALSSAVPLLVGKAHLQRANGLLGTARSTAEVCGPALAGVLIGTSGLAAILWADLLSFVAGLATIWSVRFAEERPGRAPGGAPRRRLIGDSLDGLRFLFARPSLRGLILIVFTVNLVMVFGYSVLPPMILARTGNDTAALAAVLSSIGVGGILGGLVVGVWGGPRSRIRAMLLGILGMCVSSLIAVAVVRDVRAWCAAVVVGAVLMAIVNSTEQAIIQTKVPSDRQGRVFGAVLAVSQVSVPLAMALSGPLADHLFEPQAATGTGLVGRLQPLLGTGPGSGMAAMLLIAGVGGSVVALWGLSSQPVRDIDRLVPDIEESPVTDRTTQEVDDAGEPVRG
ncbi:MFS transporter [Actinoplanes sp. NPDC026623]|uniref:MFS transporter n=1 Tax=Actinoplanes sp. NPDC026623 TaxID=3155610 RepID=UPI00340C2B2C